MKKRMSEELVVKVVGFCEPLGLGGDTQTPRLTRGRFCRDQPTRGAAGTRPPETWVGAVNTSPFIQRLEKQRR